jgi:sugar transferase (PEP-CTERM/EpsH1 system associated)
MSMRPIQVCHVVLSLHPGGLENGVVNVINGLPPDRFRSSVICLQEAGEFAARIADPTVPVIAMGLKPGNDFRLPFRVARVLRRLRPHIVHTRNIEAFFYGAVAAKLARVPRLIHSEHGRTFPETRVRAWVQRTLLRAADAAFCVSRTLRSDLGAHIGVPQDAFTVLYNGVDLDRFGTPRRNTAGTGEGPVRITAVGRLVPVKNYPSLLRALASLPTGSSWVCRMVGEGPEREALQSLADSLGIANRVQFLGHRDDVAQVLADSDIFVLPSLSEGLSNTLLEAMATGNAVIATDVGGNGEVVHHRHSGQLVPAGDDAALATALTAIVSDAGLRARYAAEAARRVREDFGMPAMIQRYADLYQSVCRPGQFPTGRIP